MNPVPQGTLLSPLGFFVNLLNLDGKRHLQPQSIPLVIDRYDLTLNRLTGGITHFAEKVTVESPLQVHRVLRDNQVSVLAIIGYPLTINQDLCAGDVEDKAFIPFFR